MRNYIIRDLVENFDALDGIVTLEAAMDAYCEARGELVRSDTICGINGSDLDAALSFGTQNDTIEDSIGAEDDADEHYDREDDDEDAVIEEPSNGSREAAAELSDRIHKWAYI